MFSSLRAAFLITNKRTQETHSYPRAISDTGHLARLSYETIHKLCFDFHQHQHARFAAVLNFPSRCEIVRGGRSLFRGMMTF
jgi:hypothetical protein